MQPTRRQVVMACAALMGPAMLRVPALAAAAQELVITTYGGVWEAFWRQSLVPAFEAATGAKTKLDIGFGRTFTSTLRAAGKDHPPYSMVMMNEIFASLLRKEGYFEKFDLSLVPHYKDLYPIAQTGDGWAAVGMISPLGLGYRTDLVQTPPKSWKDLWDNPEFQGRIGLYNIVNSAGKAMVMLTGKLFGSGPQDLDKAYEMLGKLGPVLQTDFNMSTLMSTGEIVVAPYDFGEIARLKHQGLPVECIVPEEGLLMWDQTFSICANAPARELAYKYIDFILSPETQLMLAREFFVSPVNRTVEVPEDLRADVPVYGDQMGKILAWDWDWVNANATEMTERWNRTFQ